MDERERLARIDEAFLSNHWRWCFYTADQCPPTLRTVLERELPHIAAASWPERMAWGGVWVNGFAAVADRPLTAPCAVEYYEPRFDFRAADRIFPAFETRFILHSDPDLLIVFKPAKLPSMPAREQTRYNLKIYVERHVGQIVHMPSRLDLSTSGLLVMSRTPRMHRHLQIAFERRIIEKYYLCRVSGHVAWMERRVSEPIGRDPTHPVLRTVVATGGKEASTTFRVHERESAGPSPTTLLEAQLHTGRTHQIRVHARHIGHPIIGDNFYGGERADALNLLSYRIVFNHPWLGRTLNVVVPTELLPIWIDANSTIFRSAESTAARLLSPNIAAGSC